MTYNEIVKEVTEAIENNLDAGCYVVDSLNIINRQKAEIEELKKQIEQLEYRLDAECTSSADVAAMLLGENKAKSEAVKEFAERLKEKCKGVSRCNYGYIWDEIKKVVKEMVGESE